MQVTGRHINFAQVHVSRMGSTENFEIINATDHVDSGVKYGPGTFSETESVQNLSSLNTLVHVHIEVLARRRERPEINMFADMETTKATSKHLHTLANVRMDVPTKTTPKYVCTSGGKNLADNWTPQQSCSLAWARQDHDTLRLGQLGTARVKRTISTREVGAHSSLPPSLLLTTSQCAKWDRTWCKASGCVTIAATHRKRSSRWCSFSSIRST